MLEGEEELAFVELPARLCSSRGETTVKAQLKFGDARFNGLKRQVSLPVDASYNLDLSQRRANTVKALMVDAGVPESQITAVGMGEDATYETDEQNRRVEIVLG